jgi:arginyl-tRNA synthetase
MPNRGGICMTIKDQIKEQITQVIKELDIDVVPSIDYPSDATHGDYATNIALVGFNKNQESRIKNQGITSPMELAEKIVEELGIRNKELGFFNEIRVAKPGFINFWVNDETLRKEVSEYVIPQIGKGKKVIVEYSSPNIAKPFTVGHLRSTIIGDAIANLLQAVGYEVFRDNHVGDWGTQFGKQIAALKFIDYQTKDRIENGPYLENLKKNINLIERSDRPVKLLVEFYVLFHELEKKHSELKDLAREEFKNLELSKEIDEQMEYRNRWLWKKCIEWSWKEFDEIYKQLRVSFTENNGRGYGESFFENKMMYVLDELKRKSFYKEGEEGAQIVEFPEETKLPPLMIIKKDGATLYSTRDLATDRFRLFEHEEYGKDVMIINEGGAEQGLYFQQLYKLEELLGWVKPGQRVHVKHGLYRFKEGKMSTRKGNVIWLEDVLEEVEKRAWSLQKHTSEFKETGVTTRSEKAGYAASKHVLGFGQRSNLKTIVGIGALKWNDLRRDSKQDIAFDWDEILNMQGNSGPYMQYTVVRTQSVLSKAKSDGQQEKNLVEDVILKIEERNVLRLLSRFPEIVEEAAIRYSPNILCTYLFELAQAFNLFYQKLPILKSEEAERNFRLQLTETTGSVLKRGLMLLGIAAPASM